MNVVPFLLYVIFSRIRIVIAKSQIFRRLKYRQLSIVWDRRIADSKSGYFTACLDLEVIAVMFVKQK